MTDDLKGYQWWQEEIMLLWDIAQTTSMTEILHKIAEVNGEVT